MPSPYPAYHPQGGPTVVAALEQLVRRPTSEQRLVQRAKLALLVHADPALGNAAAGQQLGQHPNWVRKWRKRWALGGCPLASLGGSPAVGTPAAAFPPGPRRRSRRRPVSAPPSGSSRSVAIVSRTCTTSSRKTALWARSVAVPSGACSPTMR